jgi:hypothetical protein
VSKGSWERDDTGTRARHAIIGAKKNIEDPGIFHKLALIPVLAWVGFAADYRVDIGTEIVDLAVPLCKNSA